MQNLQFPTPEPQNAKYSMMKLPKPRHTYPTTVTLNPKPPEVDLGTVEICTAPEAAGEAT